MKEHNEITCDISVSTKVMIRAVSRDVDLNEPLYAINWFSTKREWIYHFYNYLASKSVAKVGGRAFFKGKLTETILDQNNAAREFILIVRYPGGQNFKALVETTYFKIVSIFRIFAVKNFTFGFSSKHILDTTSKLSDNLHYAIHHLRTENADGAFISKFDQFLSGNIKVKYAGAMVAHLYHQQKNKAARQVPNLMDALVIFESQSKEEMSEMFSSPGYQSLISELKSSYIGFITRML